MGEMQTQLINKEEIPLLKITDAQTDMSKTWREMLEYGVRLGNQFKGKASISFQTNEGIRTVETTIWSATEHYLSLKGGISIPLKSITDLHF